MTKQFMTTQGSIQELRGFYDEEFKHSIIKDEDRAYRWMAKKLFRSYAAGKKVLDVGCGGGFFLKEVRQIAASALGVDLSGEALRIAAQTNPKELLLQASAEHLPYDDKMFDCVFCLGSLEHFSDISKALTEMKRVVRKDGWIFLMVPNLFWYKDILSVLKTGDIGPRNQRYEFFAVPSRWKQIISEVGLNVEKQWKYNGISKSASKQWLKDRLIPLNLSYHIIFGCRIAEAG